MICKLSCVIPLYHDVILEKLHFTASFDIKIFTINDPSKREARVLENRPCD